MTPFACSELRGRERPCPALASGPLRASRVRSSLLSGIVFAVTGFVAAMPSGR